MGKILKPSLKWLPATVFTSVLFAIMSACNTIGCTDNQNSLPLAGFYSMATHQAIILDSIGIGGVGNDSLFYGPDDRLSQAYLPFRSTEPSTSYYIRYMERKLDYPELVDTLTFTYTASPWFASEECGAMYRYRITRMDYTRHLIDSVGIVDSLITNAEMERIHIFFRTADPDDSGEEAGS